MLSTAASAREKLSAILPVLAPYMAPWLRQMDPSAVHRFEVLVWMDHFSKVGPTILAGCMIFHDTVHELFVDLFDEQLRDISCACWPCFLLGV